jgi:hypothetical protein
VVATCLLVAGPVEGAAAAHPGGSQSDRSDSGHRSDDRDRGDSRGGSERGNDDNDRRGDGSGERRRGGDNDGRKGGDGNSDRNGGDNSNRNGDNDDDDFYTESDSGNGNKSATSDEAGQRSVSASNRSAQVATSSLAPDTSDSAASDTVGGVVDVPTAPTLPVDQGGSDFSGTPSADQFTPPQVTFGNGRTPAPPEPDAQPPRVTYSAPDIASAPPPPPPPPAAPVAATPPSWVVRIAAPTAAPQLVGVAPAGWADPLFGLTGLLLIPIAGAALGYRQARAAQLAKRLRQALPQA